MARPQTIQDDELMRQLSNVFRETGFQAASLSALSKATGLKRASLYHRFPGGKEQMAREVLADALDWLRGHILEPLRRDGPPAERLAEVIAELDYFYGAGRKSCLLNMLSSPFIEQGPFSADIRHAFSALIAALSRVAMDAGIDERSARQRAERATALLQGSLVLSRGLGSTHPFENFLDSLPDELIGKEHRGG